MVLVCENPLIEKYLGMVLRRTGREVLILQADRAIEMLKSGAHQISLLITNTPAQFRQVAGELPFLYLSASPDHKMAATFPNLRVLQKPFSVAELVNAVNEMTCPS